MAITAYQPRVPVCFFNDAGDEVLFPKYDLEYDEGGGLYVPVQYGSGAPFPVDMLGDDPGIRQEGRLSIRFTARGATPYDVDATIDEIRGKGVEIGRGWIRMRGINSGASADVFRDARARLVSMPSVRWQAGNLFKASVSMDFRLSSLWYGDAVSHVLTVNEAAEEYEVTNPGTATAYEIDVSLDGTIVTPTLANVTSPVTSSVTLNRTLTAEEWTLDCARKKSYVEGVTAWQSTTLGAGSTFFLRLKPGVNDLELDAASGTPSATLTISYRAGYH